MPTEQRYTREDVFDAVGHGLAFGSYGPVEVGDLENYLYVKITASSADTAETLFNRVVVELGYKLDRLKGRRIYQLFDIFDEINAEGRSLLIEIVDAHVLDEDTLRGLKRVREGRAAFAAGRAGILLLGDYKKLGEKIRNCPDLIPWALDLPAHISLRSR